jgi:hypothetical protein
LQNYVRAEDFDGESRVYTWEPTWTNSKLKSTGREIMIREEVILPAPSQNIEKNINAGVEEDDDTGMESEQRTHSSDQRGAAAMRVIRKLKFSIPRQNSR